MAKTRIVTTQRNKAGKRKGSTKAMTTKVHRKHSGYGMRGIVKSQMTYKRKGRKR